MKKECKAAAQPRICFFNIAKSIKPQFSDKERNTRLFVAILLGLHYT